MSSKLDSLKGSLKQEGKKSNYLNHLSHL